MTELEKALAGSLPLPREPDDEVEWSVVASHDDHYDYVLTDGLTMAEALERAEYEGAPFYAKRTDDIY
jgi:hypothetical protein